VKREDDGICRAPVGTAAFRDGRVVIAFATGTGHKRWMARGELSAEMRIQGARHAERQFRRAVERGLVPVVDVEEHVIVSEDVNGVEHRDVFGLPFIDAERLRPQTDIVKRAGAVFGSELELEFLASFHTRWRALCMERERGVSLDASRLTRLEIEEIQSRAYTARPDDPTFLAHARNDVLLLCHELLATGLPTGAHAK